MVVKKKGRREKRERRERRVKRERREKREKRGRRERRVKREKREKKEKKVAKKKAEQVYMLFTILLTSCMHHCISLPPLPHSLPLSHTHHIPHTETIHSMDCADIVIGQARGERFRILDYYTRDRSTPRPDSFYDGDDDLTAAVGREVNGNTYIKFRRPLSTGLYAF